MSARKILQSPSLARQASSLKEKVLERSGKILARKNSSAPAAQSAYLAREEVQFLMEHVKTVILHLRARLLLECKAEDGSYKKSDVFGTQDEQQSKEKALSDARTIRTVAETGAKNLQNALVKFTIKSIAQVIKLIFKSAEVPLLRAEILAEILSLQDTANKNKTTVDIDDLRAVLGKAPARHIDILGQLIALLAMDTSGPSRMAYSWSQFIFFPRYDIKNSATKEYEGFDVGRQMPLIVAITQMMIEQVGEVFGLDDDDYIRRLAQEISDLQQADMRLAYEQHVRATTPAAQATTNPASKTAAKGPARPAASKQGPQIIGLCRLAYDFQAENKNELDAVAGEECYILEKGSDEWWKVRTITNGREGLVPETYVEEVAWDGVQPASSTEEKEAEPQQFVHEGEEENTETTNSFKIRSQQKQAPVEAPVAEEDEVEDEIAALTRRLNELQQAKKQQQTTPVLTGPSKKGKPQRSETQESSDTEADTSRVRSTIQSKAFDEAPPVAAAARALSAALKSPPPLPSSKMGPPPMPPVKNTNSARALPPAKPAEMNQRISATNAGVSSPLPPQRIASANNNKTPQQAEQPRVATPMPPSRQQNSTATTTGDRPQLDLNAVLKLRLSGRAADF